MDIDDAVIEERKRCVAIVEYVMLEVGASSLHSLTRVRNMIASGKGPQTFREQIEGELSELRQKSQGP